MFSRIFRQHLPVDGRSIFYDNSLNAGIDQDLLNLPFREAKGICMPRFLELMNLLKASSINGQMLSEDTENIADKQETGIDKLSYRRSSRPSGSCHPPIVTVFNCRHRRADP